MEETNSPSVQLQGDNSEINPTSSTNTLQSQTNLSKKVGKPSVNQSVVWQHFKKIEPIDKNNPKAMCNYCNRVLGCHWKNGTSGMMSHLTTRCPTSPLRKSNIPKGQTLLQMPVKNTIEGNQGVGFVKYDPIKVRNLVVRYFIKEELPFRHVESDGFRELMNGIEPRFNPPSRNTLQKDRIKLYEEEKLKLKKVLSGKRVCITIDTWTSLQNLNYMVVTASFVDHDWKMHKKIIKFDMISSHIGDDLGRLVESTMMEWGIDSLFTITVDNATNNDAMIKFLKRRLKAKPYSVLGCEFLHVRCAAHILNLVVTEGLKGLGACVSNIRNAVKFVRSSPARMAKFKSCIELEKITCTEMVCLDVQTRWNSTYLMLSYAEKYEKAFALLEDDESNHFVAPSSIDWENARIFVKFLKSFYDATLKFSTSKNVTSNSYFIQLCIIQNTLNDGICSDNPILSSVSLDMKTKYDKYWETAERINLLLYVAFVLDPRSKLKGLVFWLKRCNDVDWAKYIEESVDSLLNRLWDQYNLFHGEDGSSNFDEGIKSSTPIFSN
jgi:hypothetical protein